jgi:hypothetical protein
MHICGIIAPFNITACPLLSGSIIGLNPDEQAKQETSFV